MWWFYTVILGLSFGDIVRDLASALADWRRRPERSTYWPAVLWQVFLLILIVEVWLAVTYYRATITQLSILELVAFLCVPIGILIMSFLLPDSQVDSDDDNAVSPATDFSRVRPLFFGVFIALVGINVLHGFLIGQLAFDSDLLFQGLLLLGAIVGLFLRGTRSDVVLAIAMIAILIVYICVDFSIVPLEPGMLAEVG